MTRRRNDIQGLRAVAVGLVVIYHFMPAVVPGGFVGVDVFFVISGFLISGLLLREVQRDGRVSLGRFYARRVRRLMPAAVVTMIVTVTAASFVVGPVRLASILRDMAWTSVYLANVHFGRAPDGYFDTSDPSPFLHYWSLAVEEQYYLTWPLLLIAVLLIAKKSWPRGIGWLLVVVFVGSLVVSILLSNSGSADGYYSLASRAWELAIGGGLAFIVARGVTLPALGRTITGWVGLAMVLASAFAYTKFTPFPGWAALLPTVGTALIIWAGTSETPGWLQRILGVRPALFVGDISYSLYLWHWPVFVLGAAILGTKVSRWQLLALMGVSVLLATASYYWVERPTSSWRIPLPPRQVVAVGLTVAVAACAVPLFVASLVPTSSGTTVAAAGPSDLSLSSAVSPVTFSQHGPGVTPKSVPANLRPALADLGDDLAEVFTNGCYALTLTVCEGGDPSGTVRVVLAGDSHAGQWWPAVDAAAKANGWKLLRLSQVSWNLSGGPPPDTARGVGVGHPLKHHQGRGPP